MSVANRRLTHRYTLVAWFPLAGKGHSYNFGQPVILAATAREKTTGHPTHILSARPVLYSIMATLQLYPSVCHLPNCYHLFPPSLLPFSTIHHHNRVAYARVPSGPFKNVRWRLLPVVVVGLRRLFNKCGTLRRVERFKFKFKFDRHHLCGSPAPK